MSTKVPFRLTVACLNGDGNRVLQLPGKFIVCPRCDGRGKHVNPNIDGDGIPAEDFHNDPDFAESYFSGVFDVTCTECGGERVKGIVDLTKLPKALARRCAKQMEYEAIERSERATERMLAASGIEY